MDIVNPRTGKIDFVLNEFSAEQVAELVAEQKRVQKSWWGSGLVSRIEALHALADAIESDLQSFIEQLVEDTGRYHESVLEVDVAIQSIRGWCVKAPELLNKASARQGQIPFLSIQQSYQAYPVVGVISPWNFPLLLSLVDAIPALLAGSCVMIKPSEVTSRFVEVLNRAIAKVPQLDNVLVVVTGAGKTGAAVTEQVDSLCFTGSVATGRKVGEACAKRFIPAFLELGGKDPAIVCADADLDIASGALCWGSMVNAGQSCMSIERIYVHRDIAQPFKQKLMEKVSQLQHNYPDVKQGQIGPIISQAQIAIVERQLADAKAKGAVALCGGEVVELGGGRYCQPTLLDNVDQNMDICHQETFAAIVTITEVDSDQQAVSLANDSAFGLSAAVFSQDLNYAENLAEQLEAGAVSINDASLTAIVHEAEKQSFKFSGLGGSRMGVASISRFMRKKAFLINTGTPSPWWFEQ